MNDRRRTWKELLLEQAIQGFGISWWRADVVVGGEGGSSGKKMPHLKLFTPTVLRIRASNVVGRSPNLGEGGMVKIQRRRVMLETVHTHHFRK